MNYILYKSTNSFEMYVHGQAAAQSKTKIIKSKIHYIDPQLKNKDHIMRKVFFYGESIHTTYC